MAAPSPRPSATAAGAAAAGSSGGSTSPVNLALLQVPWHQWLAWLSSTTAVASRSTVPGHVSSSPPQSVVSVWADMVRSRLDHWIPPVALDAFTQIPALSLYCAALIILSFSWACLLPLRVHLSLLGLYIGLALLVLAAARVLLQLHQQPPVLVQTPELQSQHQQLAIASDWLQRCAAAVQHSGARAALGHAVAYLRRRSVTML